MLQNILCLFSIIPLHQQTFKEKYTKTYDNMIIFSQILHLAGIDKNSV